MAVAAVVAVATVEIMISVTVTIRNSSSMASSKLSQVHQPYQLRVPKTLMQLVRCPTPLLPIYHLLTSLDGGYNNYIAMWYMMHAQQAQQQQGGVPPSGDTKPPGTS